MRFLFCLRPFHGHLQPLVPTARALATGGHEVVFATAETFGDAIRTEGFAAVPAGLDPRAPLQEDGGDQTRDWGEAVTRSKTDDLLDICATAPPDVIVREQTDFAALLAAEVLGVPCATLGPALFIPGSAWSQLHGDRLDRIRRELGLEPDPQFERLHPYLYLDVAPPSWQLPEACAVNVLHRLRPVVLSMTGSGWQPPNVMRPLAYITLGTVYNRRPRLLRTLIEATTAASLHAVATVGRDQDPEQLGLVGIPHASVHQWLPQLDAMAASEIVIAHGGFNTVMGALALGLPLLVVPLGSDNPVHARRCRQLGVGLTLKPGEADKARVLEAITRLRREPVWRAAAQRLRNEIAALPLPDHAAELLVRLGQEGRPIPGRRRARRRSTARPQARVAVVIPTFRRAELTRALLGDVAREPSVEPVVVDNGGDYEAAGKERILRPGRNLGWAGGCNHALTELAAEPFDAYVLLNDDTRLAEGFFGGLCEAWRETGAWVVGPMYDGTWPHQRSPHAGPPDRYRAVGVHRRVPFVDGTCLFLPRETIGEVGLFDADAFPEHGWGVDFDYALRVRSAGGTLSVTELAFLHHEGNGTAALCGAGYQVAAWEEMVRGMRKKWGQAWPSLLRSEAASPRPTTPDEPDAPANACVLVLGPPSSGGSAVARIVNLLGVAPAALEVASALGELGGKLVGGADWVPPSQPYELLGTASAVEVLDEMRASVAGIAPCRPWLTRDPANDFLLPLLTAALDVRAVAILVLRRPADIAEALGRVRGWTKSRALAYWERSLRHALENLVGQTVLVARFEDVVADPVAWSARAESFLETAGIPLLVPSDRRLLEAELRGAPATRSVPSAQNDELSSEQSLLYQRALELVGAHRRLHAVELPPETPGLDDVLRPSTAPDGNGSASSGGRPSRLAAEWAEWILENRRLGLGDESIVGVLTEHGVAPSEAHTELALLRNGWSEPGYLSANRAAWRELVQLGAEYTLPYGPAELGAARERLDDPLPLPWREIGDVLCLAAGGGQQGPLFASLRRRVTVADLSPLQLQRDRDVAAAWGLEIECVEADMLDLGKLHSRQFDLVYQPVSTCYVPHVAPLYREVAKVLRPGGWYWAEHWNPVHMQLEGLGAWTEAGYRIVRPLEPGVPVRYADEHGREAPGTCWHFLHGLTELVGSLLDQGFVVKGFAERMRGDVAADPGSDEHVAAHIPPLFAVLARLERPVPV